MTTPEDTQEESQQGQGKIQLVLTGDTWTRFQEVVRRAQQRHADLKWQPRFKESLVIKRLLGLEPLDELVTKDDVAYFQGRQAAGASGKGGTKVRVGLAEGGRTKAAKKRANGGKHQR